MKRYQKILLRILAGAVLFFGGIQVYLSYYLDQRLETILTNRFATATEGAYELDIREFDLKILGRQINVKDIRLSTKQDSVDYKLQAKLDALNISGIRVLKLLISRKLSLREIELVNPSINFTASTQQNADGRKTKLTDVSRNLSEVILQALENVSVPRLSIRGFSGTYNRRGQPEEPYITFQDSYIQVQNILIDSTQIKGKRILPADHITTVFRNINLRTDNDLYELSADELHFSSDSQQLNIRSIKLAPLLNKEAFAQKVGHETDRITMSIAEINCREINFPKLNQAEGIEAQQISVQKPDIEIYRDK